MGKLTGTASRGVGILNFVWVGWGKLKLKCQFSTFFRARALKSLTDLKTCFDNMEEFKGKVI